MTRSDAKTRRAPYTTPANLPDDIRNNGYVCDLITAITKAAEAHGQPVRIMRKNADWYIAVIIPNRAELVRIDGGADVVTFGPPVAVEEIEIS